MWVDLTNTVYKQGKCDSITYNYHGNSDDTIKQMIYYWIFYKVINVIPTICVASYITINLTYRAIVTLVTKIKDNRKYKKANMCQICNFENDYEIFYCHSGLL